MKNIQICIWYTENEQRKHFLANETNVGGTQLVFDKILPFWIILMTMQEHEASGTHQSVWIYLLIGIDAFYYKNSVWLLRINYDP